MWYALLNLADFFILYLILDFLFYNIFLKKIEKYDDGYYNIIGNTNIKKIGNHLENEGFLIFILLWFIGSFTVIGFFTIKGFCKDFFSPIFFVILLIFIVIVTFRYIYIFKNEKYLKLKKIFYNDFRFEQIRNLIDDLEERKKALSEFDEYDKYRSEEVIKEELSDVNKSIELLKKMYSYLELNNSTSKVNEGYNLLKGTSMEKDELKNFEKEIDILNAKRDLDKNIDSTIEKLKNKYN